MISPDDKTSALVVALQGFKPPRIDRARIMSRTAPEAPEMTRRNRRRGAVRDAVLLALAGCHAPARVRDVHVAVCALLAEPIPRSSVKGWLGTQASARRSLVERVQPGYYVLDRVAAADALERARQRHGSGPRP